ncbi:MAG: cbb3-type cytochrome oxidase assembly protein CcoS [Gemmatimonadaceae bacterium]|nr:cbb3-type cytochrome oxidase assembly protein CcoS [Gemmatimonadaceae bacterium]MCW5827269.1 cbb3-type cytochrome oxidase assembly protein CcoS [Gemmatimonadaceae bacterium]
MSVLFLLVPLAILLVAIFVGAYVWSSRSGQFDDLTTPAMRAVHDDDAVTPPRPPREAR